MDEKSEKKMAKHWWAVLLRGIVAILFGFVALFASGLTLNVLLILIVFFLIVGGLASIVGSLLATDHKHWWIMLLNGLISIAVGIIIFSWPAITLLIMVALVAIWAILTGLFELFASLSASWAAPGKAMVALVGVLTIILGIVMLVYPGVTINVAVWLIGLYALIIGISLVFFGFKLKAQMK